MNSAKPPVSLHSSVNQSMPSISSVNYSKPSLSSINSSNPSSISSVSFSWIPKHCTSSKTGF